MISSGIASKKTSYRYETLDLLRGLAALSVVIFHFSTRLDLRGAFDHGYLAVDFFFVLSGFIVERVYGRSLGSGSLTITSFLRLRIIRMLPLVILGTGIAGMIDVFRTGIEDQSQHFLDIAITGCLGVFLFPTLWITTLEKTTFPLNGPVWSLQLELIANIAHAVIARLRHAHAIWIATAITSLVIMIYATRNQENIHVGTFPGTFLFGVARVFLAYPLGVILARSEFKFTFGSKWFHAALLVAILSVPTIAGLAGLLFDFAAVLVVFPFIVLSATGTTDSHTRWPVCTWSGNISFPLYALHYSLVRAVASIIRSLSLPDYLSAVILILTLAGFLLLSVLAYDFYDRPVRRWITQFALQRRQDALLKAALSLDAQPKQQTVPATPSSRQYH